MVDRAARLDAAAPFVEPAALVAGGDGLRVERLEYSSRGDRVTARLFRPQTGTRALAVRLVFDPNEAEDAAASFARDAAGHGIAVFAPDLPLCGRRYSPKLTEQLTLPAEQALPATERARLIEAALGQAVADVELGLEVVAGLDSLGADRMGLLAEDALSAQVAERLVAAGCVPADASIRREPGGAWDALQNALQG